jgi:hypothetical protein
MIAVSVPPQINSFGLAVLGALMVALPRYFIRLSEAGQAQKGYAPLEGHPARSPTLMRIIGAVIFLIGLGGLLRPFF